jgi:hypothetical protein
MAIAVCVNPECPQRGIECDLGSIVLAEGEVVRCGGLIPDQGPCAQPCEVR